MFERKNIAMVVAEFLGAAILSGAILAMIARTGFPFFTAGAAAAVFALLILAFDDVSGVHANPAVTLGLWTIRRIPTPQAIVYVVAQMLGGLTAWHVGEYFIRSPLNKLATGGVNWRVLIAEAVGTMIFVHGIAAASYKRYETTKKAAVEASALFVGILVASLGANGLLNPAVALGVRSWSWAYVVGPIIGAVVGLNLYAWLFAPTSPLAEIRATRSTTTTRSRSNRTSTKAKSRRR